MMHPYFLDQTQEQTALLVESPLDRYECCEHCEHRRCPRHDGHVDPCDRSGCEKGLEQLGEYKAPKNNGLSNSIPAS